MQAHALVQWGKENRDVITVFGYGETPGAAILDSYRAQNNLARRKKLKEEDVKRISTEVK